MNSFKNVILLSLMLLLAQTSLAVHDIHCLDGDHDHTCEIYFTQDHSANNDSDQKQLESVVYGEEPHRFTAVVAPNTFIPLYLSRAPPYRRL